MIFTDFENQKRIYVNNDNELKELMFDGKKVKWYRYIRVNYYDKSVSYYDRIEPINGDKPIVINNIFANTKKRLLELTKSKPELEKLINEAKSFNRETLGEILTKYEED